MSLIKILSGIAIVVLFMACNSKNNTTNSAENAEKEVVSQSPIATDQVAVYYFHSTRRCETCVAIENVSSKALKEFYNGAVSFESFNIEEDEGAKMAEKIGVTSSALIIKRGDQKIDITSEAFMYGRQQAAKLKALIKEKIEPVKNL